MPAPSPASLFLHNISEGKHTAPAVTVDTLQVTVIKNRHGYQLVHTVFSLSLRFIHPRWGPHGILLLHLYSSWDFTRGREQVQKHFLVKLGKQSNEYTDHKATAMISHILRGISHSDRVSLTHSDTSFHGTLEMGWF